MIGPKKPKPTRAEEQSAYELATLRDHDVCQRCLQDCGPIARDHRQNRSQGGLTVVENLQCLGLACHDWKTAHGRMAASEGWGVPGWADPAEYPARRWVQTHGGALRLAWVLYVPHELYGAYPKGWREISDREADERRRNDFRKAA